MTRSFFRQRDTLSDRIVRALKMACGLGERIQVDFPCFKTDYRDHPEISLRDFVDRYHLRERYTVADGRQPTEAVCLRALTYALHGNPEGLFGVNPYSPLFSCDELTHLFSERHAFTAHRVNAARHRILWSTLSQTSLYGLPPLITIAHPLSLSPAYRIQHGPNKGSIDTRRLAAILSLLYRCEIPPLALSAALAVQRRKRKC